MVAEISFLNYDKNIAGAKKDVLEERKKFKTYWKLSINGRSVHFHLSFALRTELTVISHTLSLDMLVQKHHNSS